MEVSPSKLLSITCCFGKLQRCRPVPKCLSFFWPVCSICQIMRGTIVRDSNNSWAHIIWFEVCRLHNEYQ